MHTNDSSLPLVVIVGKPNVGKSALFNRIIRSRKAIVAEEPGVTRDVNYETVFHEGVKYRIADSAGFTKARGNLTRLTRELNVKLIKEATIIIFVSDIGDLGEEDFDLVEVVRKSGKPRILVINKCDNEKIQESYYDFFRLGLEDPLPISAIHGRNINLLRERIAESVRSFGDKEIAQKPSVNQKVLNVAIVGKPNVGKSSLLNLLVQKNRALVTPEPGTTRDSVDEIMNFKGVTLRFIDTAGLRKKRKIRENVEFYSLVRTERAIKQSTVSILVIDSTQGITTQDKKIASIIDREKKGFVIAANKWDLAELENVPENDFIKDVYYDFPHVLYADIVTISALTGYNKTKLLKIILKVYNNYYKKIGTSNLNSLIHSLQGGAKDIKYGFQKSVAPHRFEFFVRNTEGKGENFKKYLINSIRENYDLRGVPIEVLLRKR